MGKPKTHSSQKARRMGHPEPKIGNPKTQVQNRYLGHPQRRTTQEDKRSRNTMGWDAFGLPAENAAIKNHTHPREWTNKNIAEFQRVLRRFGFSYDWRREISTCEPEYYRWNQWFFLRMLERGIAYKKKSRVNWCPKCCTVLANEQVVNGGFCWRHEDTRVEARDIEQWFLRTTAYAEQLLEDLKELEGGWPERVITMQRNWIGKSTGAKVWFGVEGGKKDFTTEVTEGRQSSQRRD